jgi:hypothetical protein
MPPPQSGQVSLVSLDSSSTRKPGSALSTMSVPVAHFARDATARLRRIQRMADLPGQLTYRNSSSARRRSQCRTWHSGEFSLARILHQYSTTFLINKCRTHSPVVEDSRQDHGNCARAHPFGGAGEHHVNRRTVPIDPWTRGPARRGRSE